MHREKPGPLSGSRVLELAANVAGPLGDHNKEVWGGILGLAEEELEDLRKEGVI